MSPSSRRVWRSSVWSSTRNSFSPENFLRNPGKRPGKRNGAIVGMTPSRSGPVSGRCCLPAISTRLSTSRRHSRAWTSMSWPIEVMVTWRRVRSTSWAPSSDSRSWIAVLNADCETNDRAAARPKCPSSQSATKYLSCRIVGYFIIDKTN